MCSTHDWCWSCEHHARPISCNLACDPVTFPAILSVDRVLLRPSMTIYHITYMPGLLLLWLILLLNGCGDKGGQTGLDPETAAAAALASHDQNGDGRLSRLELKTCPGIASALDHYDQDSDGAVSAAEIAERIRKMQQMPRDNATFNCTVTYNGQPLSGAEVRFQPATFQGSATKSAVGRTDEFGRCNMVVEDLEMTEQECLNFGVYCGVYRVVISHSSVTIPARYNTDTELGVHVALDTGRSGEAAVFNLSLGH